MSTETGGRGVGLDAGLERKVLHATNPIFAEYSICGMAFDAYESGDADKQILFATGGEPVTCVDCRRAVIEIRKIRLGRMRPNTGSSTK